MNLLNKKSLLALAAGLACLAISQPRLAHAQSGDPLVMIANKSNAAATGMSIGDARKLLLGETGSWRNGAAVVVVLGPPGSTERVEVLKKVCGMGEAAYTRFGMQAAFTGGNAATVQAAASDAAIKASVKTNPGAVGFIHKAQADATVQTVLELQ